VGRKTNKTQDWPLADSVKAAADRKSAETARIPTIGTKEHLNGTYTLIVIDISV
jgi:hypothetical protein